jgi:thioredoxin-dependent peroxiredoxin
MKKLTLAAAALVSLTLPSASQAALPLGAQAPQVVTQGAIGGKTFTFNLRDQLRKGPVVMYFYPKAFTQGCTLEARAFAEAHDQFAAEGASVVGMSNDDLPTLQRFSTEECRNKFAVAAATPATIRAYQVTMRIAGISAGVSNRTSYVIAPDGRVRFVHSNMDYRDHVRLTLDAVKALKVAKRS